MLGRQCEKGTLDDKPGGMETGWRAVTEMQSDGMVRWGGWESRWKEVKEFEKDLLSPRKSVVLLETTVYGLVYLMSQNYVLSETFALELKYFHHINLQMNNDLFSDMMCPRNRSKMSFILLIL